VASGLDEYTWSNESMNYQESFVRSACKSVVWYIAGISVLGSIVYSRTGSWTDTGMISFVFYSVRIPLYILHERLWNRVQWGRDQK